MTDVLCVAGARPNFMKIAPVMAALPRVGVTARLVHTGQHYDADMNDRFFRELGIPLPDVNLEVGSGTHAEQTAEVMRRFEPVVDRFRARMVLVVGDVNSTIACALVAAKKCIPVVHVEAGLRSGDRTMPEEINRVLTDQISELLFTTERSAEGNLVREGVRPESIHFVGNVMIDTLRHNLERALPAAETLGRPVARGEFGVVTLHRPSNVDDADTLHSLLGVLSEVAGRIPLALPLHPRTRARIEAAGLEHLVKKPEWILLPPQGYLQMLGLMRDAKLVLTDSGGIQEETTALGVPCITLRENTERPVTLSEGTNTLVGRDPEKIRAAVDEIFLTGGKSGRIPEYWDGHAADRIAAVIGAWLTADAGAGKR